MTKSTRVFTLSAIASVLIGMPCACRTPFAPGPKSASGDATEDIKSPDISMIHSGGPSFIRNDGQLDTDIKYYLKSPHGAVIFTPKEVVFELSREKKGEETEMSTPAISSSELPLPMDEQGKQLEYMLFRMWFEAPNAGAKVTGEKKLPVTANYYLGSNPNAWRSGIPTYAEILYENIFEGIDLLYSFERNNLKYAFVVKPGADPAKILLRYEGINGLRVSTGGDLIIAISFGELVSGAPQIRQEGGVEPVFGRAKFRIAGKNIVGVSVPTYDTRRPLLIEAPDASAGERLGPPSRG
ncbi:MAG: hypothetical protein NTZ78_14965 [Candidatus Aureabacteria bacterium]|nr:hypothetical protein [Candidatus Auribacterota bacterium]